MSRKQKVTKRPRRPTEAEFADAMRRESERQKEIARCNLASKMDSQLDALEAPFVTAYNEVEAIVGDWMNEQGFDKTAGVNDKLADIALMHSELSEAAEAIRKPMPTILTEIGDAVAEELADCIIRIMHFGSLHGHNVSGAIVAKCQANLRRPFMHGKQA